MAACAGIPGFLLVGRMEAPRCTGSRPAVSSPRLDIPREGAVNNVQLCTVNCIFYLTLSVQVSALKEITPYLDINIFQNDIFLVIELTGQFFLIILETKQFSEDFSNVINFESTGCF